MLSINVKWSLLSMAGRLCTSKWTRSVIIMPVLALSYLVVAFQSGQLNEYTERKEMNSDIVCMDLARVPPGEQRTRFLAVGLADNTVRVISLDPQVKLPGFNQTANHTFVCISYC